MKILKAIFIFLRYTFLFTFPKIIHNVNLQLKYYMTHSQWYPLTFCGNKDHIEMCLMGANVNSACVYLIRRLTLKVYL